MKNITITLDAKTAAWARRHAAGRQMSLSRYIGELLEQTMRESREYERAMNQYLAKVPRKISKPGQSYPRRSELYER